MEILTPLRGNIPLKALLLLLIIFAVFGHFKMMPGSREEKETLINFPRHFISREKAAHYPPAFSFDAGNRIHYLGSEEDNKINYIVKNKNLEKISREKKFIDDGSVVGYIFALGYSENQVYFCIVAREGRVNQPYLFSVVEGKTSLAKLPFTVQQAKDISGIIISGKPLLFFVERQEGKNYISYWGEDKGKRDVFSSENYLGLPRVSSSPEGEIHLVWKGTRGAVGIAQYKKIDLELEFNKEKDPLELGPSALYFGEIGGQPRFFQEDPGGRVLVDNEGNAYISWTDAFWEPILGVFESKIHLVKISSNGEILERWKFSGRENFSAFADLFLTKNGDVGLLFEDYANRNFNLFLSKLSEETQSFSTPKRFTNFFGNHRLASAEIGPEGDKIVLWRTMDGREDAIYGKTSLDKAIPGWGINWQLWFFQEGWENIIIESAMLFLYSLLGAIATMVRNALTIGFFAVILYIFQSYRILTRVNFFLFLGLFLGGVAIFREFFPLLYSVPASTTGVQFFSALVTTFLVVFIARKQWFKGGEEFIYIGYSILWVFLDGLIILLATTPGIFTP